MTGNRIWSLIAKDFKLFYRNPFFAFVSIAGLIAYIIIYFLMPSSVDETLRIGLYAPGMPPAISELLQNEGLEVIYVDSEEALRTAVLDAQVTAGYVIPPNLMQSIVRGDKPIIQVYFPAELPQEAKDIYTLMMKEFAYTVLGNPLNVVFSEEILGEDLVGRQIPIRDRLLPLIAVFILMIETLGLASLLGVEIEAKTLQALLITPLTVRSLFVGKGISGVGMAFIQAFILIAITGGLLNQAGVVLAALFLGALLATAFGFLITSAARDLGGILGWGVLIILVLSLPGFGVLFPGSISDWAKIIPSYYLVDTINRAINYGISSNLAVYNLAILLVIDIVIFWLGMVALRRKLA